MVKDAAMYTRLSKGFKGGQRYKTSIEFICREPAFRRCLASGCRARHLPGVKVACKQAGLGLGLHLQGSSRRSRQTKMPLCSRKLQSSSS